MTLTLTGTGAAARRLLHDALVPALLSVGVALPFGYSPTMLWILGPLCVLPTVWGFALWTLAGGIAAWWMSRPRWSLGAAAAVLSPVAVGCFALGQTALITTAGLRMLMSQDLDDPGRTEWLSVPRRQ